MLRQIIPSEKANPGPTPEVIAAVRDLAEHARRRGLTSADEVLSLILAELYAASP